MDSRLTAFTQISFHSASLSGLSCLAHTLSREGLYSVQLWRGDRLLTWVQLLVSESAGDAQVNLDCFALERAARGAAAVAATGRRTLRGGGALVVHASKGEGYRVAIHHRSDDGAVEWDSQSLQPGDVFSIVVLRPGVYSISSGNAVASFRVPYPDPRRNSGRPVHVQPIEIHLSEEGFEPGQWKLRPGKGMVIRVAAQANISVNLVEADDGPGDLAEWRRGETERLFEVLSARRRK